LVKFRTLQVDFGSRSYPIIIGSGLLEGAFDLSSYLAGLDCLIVSNETIAPLYLESLKKNLSERVVYSINLKDSESFKTMTSVESIIDCLASLRTNRDTTVIALGGGVIGDIAGFAAACYMRGVAFIQVPTTLLAQVDSSIGGKTGVNHSTGKNLIGAFHQPRLVLIDTDILATLPDRELKAGLAEVIKHGVISDAEFFGWLEENIDALLTRDANALAYAIYRSCQIKAAIVSEDEREKGKRALLNFGHTFAHAIENCLGYGEWLHGEAVAVGMMMATELSDVDQTTGERIQDLIAAAGLPVSLPAMNATKLRAAMVMDKKAQAQQLRFVLLKSIGDAYVSTDYSESRLHKILEKVNA
jgi:3-dehydroquinate synthase